MTSSPIIVGIDEAGRGALAGPIVAGACVLIPELETHPLIRDSKKLSPQQREEAFGWIQNHCTFGYGIVEASVIDAEGILEATEKAMNDAVAKLTLSLKLKTKNCKLPEFYLLVDGRDKFWFNYPHSSVIEGDSKEPCISAASIIAKVTRDRLMIERATTFPEYGFEKHKAYGSEEHREAILKYGPCSEHRKTFLRNIISQTTA